MSPIFERPDDFSPLCVRDAPIDAAAQLAVLFALWNVLADLATGRQP